MRPTDFDVMANSADSNQDGSVLGIHCLPRPVCPKTSHQLVLGLPEMLVYLLLFSYLLVLAAKITT